MINLTSSAETLKGTIQENLPAFSPTQPVQCIYTTPGAQAFLNCINVGALQANTIYFISLKVFFPTTSILPIPNLDLNFGMIHIETFNPGTKAYDAQYLINPYRTAGVTFPTVNNVNWISNDFSIICPVSSMVNTTTLSKMTAANSGVRVSTAW